MDHKELLDKIFSSTDKTGISDLIFSPNLPPAVRLYGDLQYISERKLSSEDIQALIDLTMNEEQKKIYKEDYEIDYAYNHSEKYRFRINAFRTTNGAAASLRRIATEVASIDDLGVPDIIYDLVSKSHGLILITGPTGSGKSTTLAALVDYINQNTAKHIITIEDPVEYIFESKRSIINQRQLGSDTKSYPVALKSALREDPDVIMVGEMRDPETIRLALTAAETGHLVLSTLHTNTAYESINRILDVFPPEGKGLAVALLSSSLLGVLSQKLVKRKDCKSRVAVHELLVATDAVKNLIREGNIAQIHSMMQVGSKYGMVTIEDSLQSLVSRGMIHAADAKVLLKKSQNMGA